MTDEDRLIALLRAAVPPVEGGAERSRDLWPAVVARGQARRERSWPDLVLVVAVAIALLARPDWLVLLAYYF